MTDGGDFRTDYLEMTEGCRLVGIVVGDNYEISNKKDIKGFRVTDKNKTRIKTIPLRRLEELRNELYEDVYINDNLQVINKEIDMDSLPIYDKLGVMIRNNGIMLLQEIPGSYDYFYKYVNEKGNIVIASRGALVQDWLNGNKNIINAKLTADQSRFVTKRDEVFSRSNLYN